MHRSPCCPMSAQKNVRMSLGKHRSAVGRDLLCTHLLPTIIGRGGGQSAVILGVDTSTSWLRTLSPNARFAAGALSWPPCDKVYRGVRCQRFDGVQG